MSDVNQNVVIDFTSNPASLDDVINKTQQAVEVGAEQLKTYQAINNEIVKNTAVTASNTVATEDNTGASAANQEIYDKLSRSLISMSGVSKQATQDLLKLSPDKVAAGFEELGISVDDYITLITKAGGATTEVGKKFISLRTQLQDIKNQMAQVAEATGSTSAEYAALKEQAGKVAKALHDQQEIISNVTSETPRLQLFSKVVQGVGAAFQGGVAATALFGKENEDLQETLVKVNAAMALTQALNEAVALATDAALINEIKLAANKKILIAQQLIQNGLESESVVIKYAAIIAQKALNAALNVNPIYLAIAAIITITAAIYEYTQTSKKAAEETAAFAAVLQSAGDQLDAFNEGVQNSVDKQNALLKDQGAAGSVILANTGRGLAAQKQAIIDEQRSLSKFIDKNFDTDNKEIQKLVTEGRTKLLELGKKYDKLETDQVKNGLDARRAATEEGLNNEISDIIAANAKISKASALQFAGQIQLANAQAALQLEQARGNKDKQIQIQAELTQKIGQIQNDRQKFLDTKAVQGAEASFTKIEAARKANSDRATQAEIDAQKNLLQKQLQTTLDDINITAIAKKDAQAKTDAQIAEIDRNFAKQTRLNEIEDDLSAQSVILNNIQLNEKEKLSARIFTIEDAAEKELVAARNNSEQIKAIEAKRDNDILQAKKDAIDAAASYELAVQQTTSADTVRTLEQSLQDQATLRAAGGGANRIANQLGITKQDLNTQLKNINELGQIQRDALEVQVNALNKKRMLAGSLNDDETKQYISLKDQEAAVDDATARKRLDLMREVADAQKAANLKTVSDTIASVQQGLQIVSQLFQQQDQAANAAIDARRKNVQDELDAGAITAKAASARNKELDAEQKKLQHDQAVRNKSLAIFQAIINTAAAVTAQLSIPGAGIALAIVAAALGAAEVAVIASQPIPKFDKGKKDRWSGIGEIAERNPEFVQKNGRMYLVSEPTTMYLGPDDKVFNPRETTDMMETMAFNKSPQIDSSGFQGSRHQSFDYDKMGQAVGKNIPQYGMDITEKGLTEWVKRGNLTEIYLNKRRSF